MIDINELRRLALDGDLAAMQEIILRLEAAEKSDAESIAMYRKARDERDALRAKLEAAEQDAIEQARLNGMGAERELALMAKLEVVEKERDSLRADKATLQQMTYSLKDRLEVAEKENALKERVIDALGSELNAVANGRDALRTVLTDLLNDLEERAKWNLEESQRVVACGNGVYMRAKAALEETK